MRELREARDTGFGTRHTGFGVRHQELTRV
jgi:hypothetical protein